MLGRALFGNIWPMFLYSAKIFPKSQKTSYANVKHPELFDRVGFRNIQYTSFVGKR